MLSSASAQDKPPAAPSKAIESQSAHADAAVAAKIPDVSKEAVVFDKLITRIREEADGTGTRETTARIRILADAGVKEMAVLAFTYTASNQQVDIGYVRVLKPDGSVVTTPDYNMQDMPADVSREAPMYSDIHQKHVAVKGLGVGDTLEYKVTHRTVKPEVPGHFWLEYAFQKDLISLDEELDLDVPADKNVTVASTDTQPTITTAAGRKLYHWTSSNLARPDPDAPAKSTKHWKPSVQVTTFTSWQQVGAWYKSLAQQSLAVTPAIQAKADTLAKGLTTNDEKANALFSAVALHIHYVGLSFGIGRYQPHPADDVLSNEYGDCKDKHTLLTSLLKAEGIEAWPVLISSSRELDPDLPSPAQFDHVITLVPLGGKLVWMDSTEEVAPVGALAGILRDKQALAIPNDKPAYLERTPVDLPFPQSARFQADGKLSAQGEFVGHIDQTYHGDVEMVMRAAFRQVPQSQWKEFLQRVSGSMGFGGEVKEPVVSPVENTGEPFHFAYDYTREKFGEWEDRRINPPMPPVGWELIPGVKQKKPADDVEIGSPGEQEYVSTVEMPAGWTVFPPQGVDLKEDWAEYHSKYNFANGKFTAERRLVFKKEKVPLADWDKYLAFREAIYADTARMSPVSDVRQAGNGISNGIPRMAGSAGDAYEMFGTGRMQQMYEQLQPVRDAAAILSADPPPSMQDVAKANSMCKQAVNDFEAKSLEFSPEDPHALYWPQMLASAWTCLGWAEIESKEVGAAEIYLRPAWKLSQNPLTGYQLARALEAKGSKAEAAHLYELAFVSSPSGSIGLSLSFDGLHDRINAAYKKLTGKELAATSLNRGVYQGSLRAELDKDIEIRQFIATTKLNGQGLFAVAFEADKPVKVTLLHGDKGMGTLAAILQGHRFPVPLPTGSKVRVLREVRMICTQYGGCDAYMLLPTAIQIPTTTSGVIEVKAPPITTQGAKTIQIRSEP